MGDDSLLKAIGALFVGFVAFVFRSSWADRKEQIDILFKQVHAVESRINALEKKSEGVDVHIENLRELKDDMRKIRDLLNILSGNNQ